MINRATSTTSIKLFKGLGNRPLAEPKLVAVPNEGENGFD